MTEQPPPGWVPPAASAPPGYGASGPAAPSYGPPGTPYGAPWGPPVHKPGVVALRPLNLGDFFDGAFKTIRRNPRTMVGLAAVVSTVFMVVPVLITLALASHGDLTNDAFDSIRSGDTEFSSSFGSSVSTTVARYLGTFFESLATILLTGMLVHVVAEAVLGRRTGVGEAWSATRGRMLRLVGLTLLDTLVSLVLFAVPVGLGVLAGFTLGVGQGFLIGVPLLLLGAVAWAFVQVRYFLLAPPALVLEKSGIIASLRRAGQLSRRQFWRLLGISLLTRLVVGLAGSIVALPLGLVAGLGPFVVDGTGGALIAVFATYLSQIVVGAITTPFTSAVVALQYIDQRIRKEGLDVSLIAASAPQPDLR